MSNRPWFVDWQAAENLDPNPSYWTAHYAVEDIGTFTVCDGEGGDRSYFNQGSTNSVYIGCHMERMNQLGAYFSNSSGAWIGGDWYSANTAPAFSGITCNLTIDSFSQTAGMAAGAITIGSFPNTYGGRVTVRNTPPVGGDSAPPLSSSLVTWDAYTQQRGTAAISETVISTVGAGVLTGAALVSGILLRGGGQSGAFNDTTDNATNIIAAISPPPAVGASIQCQIQNTTSYTQTLLAGSGVTFSGNLSLTATILTQTSRVVTIIVTNITSPAVKIAG